MAFKNTGFLPIPATQQLRVVPEGDIAPYVTVVPPKFPPVIKRGDTVTFSVTVTVPESAPIGVAEGELMLKRVIGTRVVDVWRAEGLAVQFTFSPIPLPPDPGEAGKLTIEGIDADGDGVRDDVQRWIVFTVPEDAAKRDVLLRYSEDVQASLLAFEDPQASINASYRLLESGDCLSFLYPEQKYTLLRDVRARHLNTMGRYRADMENNKHFGGQTYGVPSTEAIAARCSFDVYTREE